MKHFSRLAALLALLALGAGPANAQMSEGTITFIHAVDGANGFPVDVYVDDVLMFDGIKFMEGSPAMQLPAGAYDVDVLPGGGDPDVTTPALSASLDVTGGANLSVVASVTETGQPTITIYANDTSPVPAGMVRITFRHGAAAPAMDVMVDGVVTVADFTNSDDMTKVLEAGGYRVSLTPTEGGGSLFEADLDLSEGTAYVVYGVGSVEEDTFDAALQVLGQFFQMPDGIPSGTGGLADSGSSPGLAVVLIGTSLVVIGFGAAVWLRRREMAT